MTEPRPRSLGEVFDRGVVLLVRTLVRALVIIGALLVAAAAVGGLALVVPQPVQIALLVVAVIVFLPAMLTAGAALLYLFGCEAASRACSIPEAVAAGWQRALSLFGTTIMVALASAVLLVPVFVAAILAAAIGALASVRPNEAIAVGIVTGIPMILVLIACFALAQTVSYVAYSACVVEGANPVQALVRGVERCVTRAQYRRAIVVGLAILAPSLALSLAEILIEALAPTNSALLVVVSIAQVTLSIPAALIGYAWGTAFSFDARIRREGLDLAFAASRM